MSDNLWVQEKIREQAYAYGRYQDALRNGWDFLDGLEISCSECGGNWTLAGKLHGHHEPCSLAWQRKELSYYDLSPIYDEIMRKT